MKNYKLVSLILIFVGTLVFGFSLVANSALIAPHANDAAARTAVEALGIFKFNSIVQAVSIVLLFIGVIILVTEYVLSIKNKD